MVISSFRPKLRKGNRAHNGHAWLENNVAWLIGNDPLSAAFRWWGQNLA